jgi:hypothetical protein
MATIRFPASAVPLLPLCKGHGGNYIFRTYADFVGFVAAYGFHLSTDEGFRAKHKPRFVDTPNPIDLEVFENRNLYSNLLIMALAHPEGLKRAEDESAIAEAIENYAAIGAEVLADNLKGGDMTTILREISGILCGSEMNKI